MRYRRVFLRDVCVAEDAGDLPAATLSADFWCPACGRIWARLESATSPSDHLLVRHYCSAHPSRLLAAPPSIGWGGDVRIPGSLFPSHFSWASPTEMGRLVLTFPLLARSEALAHLNPDLPDAP